MGRLDGVSAATQSGDSLGGGRAAAGAIGGCEHADPDRRKHAGIAGTENGSGGTVSFEVLSK